VWWSDRRHVLIASETAQLVAHGAVTVKVNEAMLAEAYAHRLHSPTETLVDGVNRVAAGRALIFGAHGDAHEGAWSESPLVRSPHRCPSEWIDEYRCTFARVVGDAVDTAAPPTLAVSGGLDSSSILCTAAHYGTLDPQADLATYDVRHEGADPPMYIEAIEARTGLTIPRLPLPAYDWPRTVEAVQERFVLPMRRNAALHRSTIDDTSI
jgi:asparagine synthase (glutamine-hydrolysing)